MSGEVLPTPSNFARLDFQATYTEAEFNAMQQGFAPRDMDDRWRIDYAGDWLYLRRSWTGFCIYWLRLERSANGARVIEAYVSREETQYRGVPLAEERKCLAELIDGFLLKRGLIGEELLRRADS